MGRKSRAKRQRTRKVRRGRVQSGRGDVTLEITANGPKGVGGMTGDPKDETKPGYLEFVRENGLFHKAWGSVLGPLTEFSQICVTSVDGTDVTTWKMAQTLIGETKNTRSGESPLKLKLEIRQEVTRLSERMELEKGRYIYNFLPVPVRDPQVEQPEPDPEEVQQLMQRIPGITKERAKYILTEPEPQTSEEIEEIKPVRPRKPPPPTGRDMYGNVPPRGYIDGGHNTISPEVRAWDAQHGLESARPSQDALQGNLETLAERDAYVASTGESMEPQPEPQQSEPPRRTDEDLYRNLSTDYLTPA